MSLPVQAVTAAPSIESFQVGADFSTSGTLEEIMARATTEAAAQNKQLDAVLKSGKTSAADALLAQDVIQRKNWDLQFTTNALSKIKTVFEKLVLSPS